MKVKLLDRNGRGVAVGGRTPGKIMDVSGGVADHWVRRGLAVLVPDDAHEEKMVPQNRNAERMTPRNRRTA